MGSDIKKKVFIWITGSIALSGTQGGQELDIQNLNRENEGVLLTGLLLLACSVCFLILLRPTCLEVALPTVGWAPSFKH